MCSEREQWLNKEEGAPTVVFAHGAGAGPDSEFMHSMARNLAAQGLAVLRFEFDYWTQVRRTGKRRPPERQPALQARMLEVCAGLDSGPLWLMGKSMGARVAFRCADAAGATGAIGLGFPFHANGKAHKTRTHELTNTRPANLVVQGTRDVMGRRDWVEQQELPDNLKIIWRTDANHDLVAAKAQGIPATQGWLEISQQVADFIKEHD
ncbi:alpha/beta family hydrolase [Aliidiomarina sp. Khilg15.8]